MRMFGKKSTAEPEQPAEPSPATSTSENSDEAQQHQAILRAAAFGEIMSLLLQSPRHANVTLGNLTQQMLPAFLAGQYALARAKKEPSDPIATPIGVAFWASVSSEVDQRLASTPEKPITLAANEWNSGDIIWLIDVVAPQNLSNALIKSVRERVGSEKQIKVRATDPDGNTGIQTID